MKITYDQAAEILEKKPDTIAHAVSDGTLIPYPRAGRVRFLESEQVELFKDKALNKRALDPENMEKWALLRLKIEGVSPVQAHQYIPNMYNIPAEDLRNTPESVTRVLVALLLSAGTTGFFSKALS